MKKIFFFLTVILSTTFFLFQSTLNYYFISDDFFYTSFKNVSAALSIHKGEYHYNPIFWSFLLVIKQIWGLNPFIFHLFTLIIHLINIILVFSLTNKITKNKTQSLISALIFALFFSHYEVVFWITGINTSLMVSFYILSLIAFISFNAKPTMINYTVFFLFFLLALLTHEYAVSLLSIVLTYWLIFAKRNKTMTFLLKLILLPATSILVLTIAKISWSSASLVVKIPTLSRFLSSIIKSFLYLFIPIPYLIDALPKILLPLIFLFLTYLLLATIKQNKLRIFLFIWVCLTVTVFSATSLPQARYFYLSSIPAILLLTSIIIKAKSKLSFLGFIYLIVILTSGIIFIQKQKQYWQESSSITKKVLTDIKKLHPNPDKNKNIYFINLPDSTNGPPWNAYVFRRGLNQALENIYGYQLNLIYLRTIPRNEKVREDQLINQETLTELKNRNEAVFIYNQKN